MQKILHISGMTCQHCVRRVENALQELDGLGVEQIDLETGTALVDLAKPLADQLLRQTVEDAGYQLTQIENR